MTQIINLNTPGKADGSLEVLHEGISVMKFDQVHWRSEANVGFSGIDFATFFGGSDKTWATKTVSLFLSWSGTHLLTKIGTIFILQGLQSDAALSARDKEFFLSTLPHKHLFFTSSSSFFKSD